jgi:protein transport protein SEC23
MLENPIEYVQSTVTERIPVPRFVTCDFQSPQERLIKSVLNPNVNSNSKLVEQGYYNDDVSCKVFMDHLKKKAVQS